MIIKRYFYPGVYGSAPPAPPPELSIASVSCCLRLQVGLLTWSGSTSHSGCGMYSLACLPLVEGGLQPVHDLQRVGLLVDQNEQKLVGTLLLDSGGLLLQRRPRSAADF